MNKPDDPREQLKDLVIKQKKTQLPTNPLFPDLKELHDQVWSLDEQLSEIVIQVILQDPSEAVATYPSLPSSIFQRMEWIDQWFLRNSGEQQPRISFYQTYYHRLVNTIHLLKQIIEEE